MKKLRKQSAPRTDARDFSDTLEQPPKKRTKALILGIVFIVTGVALGATAGVEGNELGAASRAAQKEIDQCAAAYDEAEDSQKQLQTLLEASKPWIPVSDLVPTPDSSPLPLCPGVPKRNEIGHLGSIMDAAKKNRNQLVVRAQADSSIGLGAAAIAFENAKTQLKDDSKQAADSSAAIAKTISEIRGAGGELSSADKTALNGAVSAQAQWEQQLMQLDQDVQSSLDSWAKDKTLTGTQLLQAAIDLSNKWSDLHKQYADLLDTIKKTEDTLKGISETVAANTNTSSTEAPSDNSDSTPSDSAPTTPAPQTPTTPSQPQPTPPVSGSNGAQNPNQGENGADSSGPVFCYEEDENGDGHLVPCD